MKEPRIRRFVIDALKPLHAIAVENPAHPGDPDVDFVHGKMELKQITKWPVRSTTKVRVRHFTQGQRTFLLDRSAAGENTWLLLVVGREWLLFDGIVAAWNLGHESEVRLRELAAYVWTRRPKAEELLEAVRDNT